MPSSKAESETIVSIGLQTVPEIKQEIQLSVIGTIPEYLSQMTLYRVGPGRYDVNHSDGKPHRIGHWFDGLSLLHSFQLNGIKNTVCYKNRFLVDDIIRTIEKTPSTRWNNFSFGSTIDPCRNLFSRFFQLLTKAPVPDIDTGDVLKPNIGVTIQNVPGKGVCIRSDIASNYVLNEEKFEIEQFYGFQELHNELNGLFSASHGHYDANTEEFFNFVYSLSGLDKTEYSIFRINKQGKTEILTKISHAPCYLHSITATDNYVILVIWPMIINPLKALWHRNIADASCFNKDVETKFYVISRETGDLVSTFTSHPFFCFHYINAYEDEDNIIIDLCKYKDCSIVSDLKLDNLKSASKISASTISRFTLQNISTISVGKAIETTISKFDFDLPRINPDYIQKKYQFAYGVSTDGTVPFNVVSKVNVDSGERSTWTGEQTVVGEPIFVQDPKGIDEDDGCLLVIVLNAKVKKSSLIILDAKTLDEIVFAQVPQVVPLGFHGMAKKLDTDEI